MDGVPLLVIREFPNGHVEGVVMLQPDAGYARPLLVEQCAEPDEVENEIAYLLSLAPGETYMGCKKLRNVKVTDCAWALTKMPAFEHGQKEILMYSEIEWFGGVLSPEPDGIPDTVQLRSVADKLVCRVSASKLAKRADLELAIAAQTVAGDYAVFDQALQSLTDGELDTVERAEETEAIQVLCRWWNATVAEEQKLAGAFLMFEWNQELKLFVSTNPNQPPVPVADLAMMPSYTIFHSPGRPTLAIVFYRAQEFNRPTINGTQIYYANGDNGGLVNGDPEVVDVAYLALLEMHALSGSLNEER